MDLPQMRMTTTYWVAALALIAVAIGVRQGIFRIAAPTSKDKAGQYRANPAISITSGRELSGDPRLATSNESPLANVDQSATDSGKLAIGTEARDQGEPVSKNRETLDPAAVIGRAFPISAAVEADCKRKQDYICNDVQQKLSKMRQEPRDPVWAPEMEALIQHDVLLEEQPDRFRIRYIECRTSLCAAEVESTLSMSGTYGSYMGGMQVHHDALNAALHTNFNTFAYETDPSGARVTVTVITFSRR